MWLFLTSYLPKVADVGFAGRVHFYGDVSTESRMADRYKIYEKLGMGGVGAVFRAYDSQLKRWVAIKRLMTAAEAEVTDEETQAELRREADALASLRNPNIVTIFDVASDEEGLFIVMELLTGEDLADVVARGPLPYDDFKELANQTLEGLLAAHQHHILHRDIKPENIKVERLPGGRLASKIIDFGLARAGLKARKQTEDQSGTVMGSIHYMAPEQLTREPVDERTDLYSLGCVFYEALSGRKAFDGPSMADVIDKHINHHLTPLAQIAPHVPQWMDAWVARLMAGKPDERPANAQQAIEEFRAWEKMPTMPYGAWTPPPIYPQQAHPGNFTQPMYYHTGAIPAQDPNAYQQPAPMVPGAIPVVEEQAVLVAAFAAPLAPGPRKPVPQIHRPGAGRAPVSVPQKGSGDNRKKKKLIMIGGGVAVLVVGGFLMMRSGGAPPAPSASGDVPAAPSSQFSSGGNANVTETLPQDRAFPPADKNICVHLVSNVGQYTNRKGSDGTPAKPNKGESVMAWRDLSERGGDNMLLAFHNSPDSAPRREDWPTNPGGPSVKGWRWALDFHPKPGKGPVSMVLASVGSESANFPFGGASVTAVEEGLTFLVAFQADKDRLPVRVATLSGADSEVVVRVLADGTIEAEFKHGSEVKKLAAKDVKGYWPSVATVTWKKASGELGLRARDANGRTYNAPGGTKVKPPGSALTTLSTGRSEGANKSTPAPADQFVGYVAEIVAYAGVLKLDQLQVLDGTVVANYFFEKTPPPKPLVDRLKRKLPVVGDSAKWKFSANRNPGELRFVTDGGTNTRWKTNEAQKPGMWLMVELPTATRIAGLALDTESSINDYPRGYKVETSLDGKTWNEAANGKGEVITEVQFPSPVSAKFVRITMTEKDDRAVWGVSEMVLFKGN
ncbi:MAG: protein kinase [Verrucomicrobiales bacterium]|nr:protein kinase [Verrucomicrobiales bacterium]MCP5556848.1 protein kinase [Verrucomicrobiaceae bacterium]